MFFIFIFKIKFTHKKIEMLFLVFVVSFNQKKTNR